MSKIESKRSTRVKRKLDLADGDDELEGSKKKSANTAVEISECSTRSTRQQGSKVNKGNKQTEQHTNKVPDKLKSQNILRKEETNENKKKRSDKSPSRAKLQKKPQNVTNEVMHNQGKFAGNAMTNVSTAWQGQDQFTSESSDLDGDGIFLAVDPVDDDFEDENGVEILPPAKPNEEMEEIPVEVVEQLKNHPVMQQYIDEVVKKCLTKHSESTLPPPQIDQQRAASLTLNNTQGVRDTTENGKQLGNKLNKQSHHKISQSANGNVIECNNPIKSPSDTTIYTPALCRNRDQDEVFDKISKFVEQVRINMSGGRRKTPEALLKQPHTDHQKDKQRAEEHLEQPSTSEGRWAGDNIVIDAEQFKAKLQPPKGESYAEFAKVFKAMYDDDDEFFHITYHIDSGLRSKIARGDFIDLERLLSKEKCGGNVTATNYEESKVELVSRGGHTFFKPVKENQITGLRKWEQAFRVYAAVYTDANPERSGEIWQYMHTINVAASSFHWDNVANYDVTFRQLIIVAGRKFTIKAGIWQCKTLLVRTRQVVIRLQQLIREHRRVREIGAMIAVGNTIRTGVTDQNAIGIIDALIVGGGTMDTITATKG